MQPVHTWVVVADGGRARFLENEGPGKGLHPAGVRPLTNTLKTDLERGTGNPDEMPGSGMPETDSGENPVEFHRFEKERFAQDVAEVIARHRQEGDFDRLVLVAPAKALGELRKTLDPHSRDLVYAEIDKDWTKHDDLAIADLIGDTLAV